MRKSIQIGVVAGLAVAAPIAALPALTTQYVAVLERIIDADTQVYQVGIWPGLTQEIAIRIDGIDTPEKRRPANCSDGGAAEKALAEEATEYVSDLIQPGAQVLLLDVSLGKFAGRALAQIRLVDGRDLGALLIDEGYAVAYDGGTKTDWCQLLERKKRGRAD
ncbi:thermonuclease family protein [Pararhizobium sp.]|uniref:thermonuclease family protein n=1 Tax=Pararhizobium sp. TaxID=1977563 RepID=UPI003D12C0AE